MKKISVIVSSPDEGGCWISFVNEAGETIEEVITEPERVGSTIQAHLNDMLFNGEVQ